MLFHVLIWFLFQIIHLCLADHYKGGTISWRPANPYSLVSPILIYITERHSWTLTRYQCNQTTVSTLVPFNDTQNTVPATLECISSSSTCNSSLYQTINSPLYCTDFSPILNVSSGTYITTQSLSINSSISIAWRGTAWATELLANSWSLVATINLTIVAGNKINTSPVTASLPVIRVLANRLSTLQILVADWDTDQITRCRWSYQSSTDECGDACASLPNSLLKADDCYVNWTGTLRPVDVANGLNQSSYILSIIAEDFTDPTSTTPLSSIPQQVIVQVYTAPSDACPTMPTIVSAPRRTLSCFGVTVNSLFTFNIQARVYCPGDYIVEFPSLSPFNMQKLNISQLYNDTWIIYFRWTPRANQTGVQPFCVAAIDNHGVSTTQYCMAMAVGASGTVFITPTFVQGSASPVGTVLRTLSRFSIQANVPIKRTSKDVSQIRIYRNITLVYYIDCRTSPDVFYFNKTMVFYVRYPWTPGMSYYVVLLEGVATADQYCGMENPAYWSNAFWPFTIWDPSLSSTTTPSTTTSTATTHTITTRQLGTTPYNSTYTTTGVPPYLTTTTTSTTSTSSTTVTSTTTTSATSTTSTTTTTTEYIPNADVLYPKDMQDQCVQPVTIATLIVNGAILPIHLYAMINLFIKMLSNFQQGKLKNHRVHRIQFNKTEENQRLV